MKERDLIFISHANPEDNEFASWLGTRLTIAGYHVWADVLNLRGGEQFWLDIGEAIKKDAIVFIVALSRTSFQKDGVLNEIALATNTGRHLGREGFIIPIRLDDLPFSDFPEQLIRLNAIDFSSNWADGFSKLLKALKEDQVPRSTSELGEALGAWQEFRLRQSATISETPESVLSNWFQIQSLPSHINFVRFNASQKDVELAFARFQSPSTQYQRLAVSFADIATLQGEVCEISLEHAYRVPLAQFLDGEETDGPKILRPIAQNMIVGLLREAWEQFARSRGLSFYEFAHGHAWFVPLDWVPGNIATFRTEDGKLRRRRLVGRSETRSVHWHFAVSGTVSLVQPQHFALRPHVVFTQDGKTPVESKTRAANLRKRFCKNWWNDRWRDLLRAFVAVLAEGKGEFSVPLGGEAAALIAATPIGFDIARSIVDDTTTLTSGQDHQDHEIEADAFDDLDNDQGEEDVDDIFVAEDETHEGEA